MSGEELKKILVADGVVLSELATALGYQGDQWLHSALKAADVKSGLIERIAAATKKSVCHYYRGSNITAEGTNVALGDGEYRLQVSLCSSGVNYCAVVANSVYTLNVVENEALDGGAEFFTLHNKKLLSD